MSAPYPLATVFTAPDTDPGKERYTCSFHWFRAADGRIVGLDVVRSEDEKQRMALRVFVAARDGAVRAMIHEAPVADWAPFEVAVRGAAVARTAGRDVLGRGENWVAGSVAAASDPRGISSAAFELDLTIEAPGLGPARLGRPALRMSVIDYPSVHYRGFVQLDGERLAIDAEGSASVHFGLRLVHYVFLASVPDPARPDAPQILLAAAQQDDLPVGGVLLGDRSVIYAYGRSGVPPVMLHAATLDSPSIPVGWGASIELSDVRVIAHTLLDEPTRTASAQATLVRPAPTFTDMERTERLDLGRVMVDCRNDAEALVLPG
jgi:hypothetical protein